MKNSLLLVVIVVAAACGMPSAALAFDWRIATDTTNAVALEEAETFESEALLAGYSVDMQGTAKRDLWVTASSTAFLSGHIEQDVRFLARTTIAGGKIGQNLMGYSAAVQLTTNSIVDGDLLLFGNTIICEGAVAGNAWIFGDAVTLGGSWGGNVHVTANQLTVIPNTQIKGNLSYMAQNHLVLDQSVTVTGAVTQKTPIVPKSTANLQNRFYIAAFLFMAALLTGMPFVGVFPLAAGGAVRNIRRVPWRVFLAGLIAVFGVPIMLVFIFITGVGMPLAVVLFFLWGILAYLAHIVVALWLGHLVLPNRGPQTIGRVFGTLAVGLALVYLIYALPGISGFMLLPIQILGMGALSLSLIQRRHYLPVPPAFPPPPTTSFQPPKGPSPSNSESQEPPVN